MQIKSFTFNPFQTNCYVCHEGTDAVLIDPASYTEDERSQVLDYIDRNKLEIRHLLLTHAHIDHIFDCAFFSRHFSDRFKLHRKELLLLKAARDQAAMFGVTVEDPPAPEVFLDEGGTISFGNTTWEILLTPGHSPGSICFLDRKNTFVVSGDVLFNGSIGRTDLWMGSLPQLRESIEVKLLPLGDEIRVYPGHGPDTTIGEERRTNPFLLEWASRY